MKQINIEGLDRATAAEIRKKIMDGMRDKPDSFKKPGFVELYRNCKKMLGHMQKEAYLFYEITKAMEIEYERNTGERLE